MKILVTGCAGFIGFHLAKILLERNKNILGIDNLNNYYDVSIKKKRLQILKQYKIFLDCMNSDYNWKFPYIIAAC
mgnify:CR=1 FL=1